MARLAQRQRRSVSCASGAESNGAAVAEAAQEELFDLWVASTDVSGAQEPTLLSIRSPATAQVRA